MLLTAVMTLLPSGKVVVSMPSLVSAISAAMPVKIVPTPLSRASCAAYKRLRPALYTADTSSDVKFSFFSYLSKLTASVPPLYKVLTICSAVKFSIVLPKSK